MINNPVGINTDWASMTNNVIADHISQLPNHTNPLTPFLSLMQEFLQLQHYNCFLLSAELVSFILNALVCAKLPDLRDSNWQKLHLPNRNVF